MENSLLVFRSAHVAHPSEVRLPSEDAICNDARRISSTIDEVETLESGTPSAEPSGSRSFVGPSDIAFIRAVGINGLIIEARSRCGMNRDDA